MNELLFWLYISNATLLICHEIDSAYWKEWEMFNLPGGITGFLLIHLPVVFLVLLGLIKVHSGLYSGYIYSLVLAASGMFAFIIHMVFMMKGRNEFKSPMSLFILISTFVVSIVQAALVVSIII